MATKVVMAQLSPTMEEGKLLEWKVAEGDSVEQGDILAEIETDKANMDVESLGEGILRKIVVSAGATVPVGSLIGVIADEDEDISAILAAAESASASAASTSVSASASTPVAEPPAAAEPPVEIQPAADAPPVVASARVKASPLARRLAREAGLSLASLRGSGPGGRVVRRDVEAAASAPPGTVAMPTAPAPVAGSGAAAQPEVVLGSAGLAAETIEVSQMRKAIARRLTQSIGPVPHFFLTTEIDMEAALDLRARLNSRLAAGKVGVNDLLIKVAAAALVRHPEINASWAGDTMQRHGSADIGVAVALDGGGLITPIIRSADRKGLLQISVEARALIQRARERKLLPEEYQGATFSISNLGMFEIDEFTAIINPPEAAILAVGRTEERPVAENGEVVVRRRMRVTMSCDHRVIDGALGAAFLGTFKAMMENPLEMVV